MALNERLEVASRLANIENIETVKWQNSDTEKSYDGKVDKARSRWARRLLNIADVLIEVEKETRPKDTAEIKRVL